MPSSFQYQVERAASTWGVVSFVSEGKQSRTLALNAPVQKGHTTCAHVSLAKSNQMAKLNGVGRNNLPWKRPANILNNNLI